MPGSGPKFAGAKAIERFFFVCLFTMKGSKTEFIKSNSISPLSFSCQVSPLQYVFGVSCKDHTGVRKFYLDEDHRKL